MLCIGHRGAAGHAPENTITAIRKGIELGADWIEIDVYCIDNQIVIFHDDRLERTTNGRGRILDHSFEQLRSLQVLTNRPSQDSPVPNGSSMGERVPTLGEVFETLSQVNRPVGLNIELKGPNTARPVVEFLAQRVLESSSFNPQGSPWPLDRLLISSFQLEQLEQVRSRAPQLPLGALFWNGSDRAIAQAQALGATCLNLRLEAVTAEWVQRVQAAGLQLWVYTVNEPADLERMQSLGVDAVFSDYPDRVRGLSKP